MNKIKIEHVPEIEYNRYNLMQITNFAIKLAGGDDVDKTAKLFESLESAKQQEFIRVIMPHLFKKDSALVLEFILDKIQPNSETLFFIEAIKQNAYKIAKMYIDKRNFVFGEEIKTWIHQNRTNKNYEKIFIMLDKEQLEKVIDGVIARRVEANDFRVERKIVKI